MSAVLFENDDLLAIDKPAGLSSLPYAREELDRTAAGLAVRHCPSLESLGLEHDFGAAHRLDQGTSGVLLFAKNLKTHLLLRELWKTDQVAKTYRALTTVPPSGAPSTPFTLTTPIGHDEKSSKKMRAILDSVDLKRIRGKAQDTHSEIQKITACDFAGVPCWDWTVRIKTGVRHQVRVHLASLSAPILGDAQYRGLASSRLWLHSWELKMTAANLPSVTIRSPLSSDWPKPN